MLKTAYDNILLCIFLFNGRLATYWRLNGGSVKTKSSLTAVNRVSSNRAGLFENGNFCFKKSFDLVIADSFASRKLAMLLLNCIATVKSGYLRSDVSLQKLCSYIRNHITSDRFHLKRLICLNRRLVFNVGK